MDIECASDWWLGDLSNRWYQAAEAAISKVWGMRPLHIREGGSIPGMLGYVFCSLILCCTAIRWLENYFRVPALHLPMGQSSDSAHLANERIRMQNLFNGMKVVQEMLEIVSVV